MNAKHFGICDRCGMRYDRKTLRKEWTNLLVCGGCFEEKHPQLTPYSGPLDDPVVFTDARPETAPEPSVNTAFDETFPHTAGGEV